MVCIAAEQQRTDLDPDSVDVIDIIEQRCINVSCVNNVRSFIEHKQLMPTDQLLATYGYRTTTLDQDRVFAMLGVLPEWMKTDFAVDVKASYPQVFLEASKTFLSNDPCITLLHLIGRHNLITRDRGIPPPQGLTAMPSWTHDFRHIEEGFFIDNCGDYDGFHPGWVAKGETPDENNPKLLFLLTDTSVKCVSFTLSNHLLLEGYQVDTIQACKPSPGSADDIPKLFFWLTVCSGLALLNIQNRSQAKEALWRTMTLNRIGREDDGGPDMVDVQHRFNRQAQHDQLYRASQRTPSKTKLGPISSRAWRYFFTLESHLKYPFFSTGRGRIGRCRENATSKDIIVVVEGARTPFILRPLRTEEEEDVYEFVSDAYVHGIMQGEVMQHRSEYQRRTFKIR